MGVILSRGQLISRNVALSFRVTEGKYLRGGEGGEKRKRREEVGRGERRVRKEKQERREEKGERREQGGKRRAEKRRERREGGGRRDIE